MSNRTAEQIKEVCRKRGNGIANYHDITGILIELLADKSASEAPTPTLPAGFVVPEGYEFVEMRVPEIDDICLFRDSNGDCFAMRAVVKDSTVRPILRKLSAKEPTPCTFGICIACGKDLEPESTEPAPAKSKGRGQEIIATLNDTCLGSMTPAERRRVENDIDAAIAEERAAMDDIIAASVKTERKACEDIADSVRNNAVDLEKDGFLKGTFPQGADCVRREIIKRA
jgi:hypothetical protein